MAEGRVTEEENLACRAVYHCRESVAPAGSSGSQLQSFEIVFSKYAALKERYYQKEINQLLHKVQSLVEEIAERNIRDRPYCKPWIESLRRIYSTHFDHIIRDKLVLNTRGLELIPMQGVQILVGRNYDTIYLLLTELFSSLGLCVEDTGPVEQLPHTSQGERYLPTNCAPDCLPSSREQVVGPPTLPLVPRRPLPPRVSRQRIRDRRRKRFAPPALEILKHWVRARPDDPYPSIEEKSILASRTGLTVHQISNWFVNYRVRKLKFNKDSRKNKMRSQIRQQLKSSSEGGSPMLQSGAPISEDD